MALEAAARPLRVAYADPPYPGMAGLYRGHRDFGGEVDHAALVGRLVAGYPDGWALSTSARALPAVLALCPPGVRVAAWVRGERPNASATSALSGWEPVIFTGGRAEPWPLEHPRRVDALVYTARPRRTDPDRVTGAKPAAFAWWLFRLLGLRPGDQLDDLFPGSGGIARAWALVSRRAAANGDASTPATHDPSPLQAWRSTS